MITTKAVTVIVLLAVSVSMAFADTEVTRQHTFEGEDITSLRLDISVGTLTVEPSDTDNIEVTLTISTEDRSWFRRSPNVEKMNLRNSRQGHRLRLGFNEKNVKTEWLVKVPDLDQLDIDLGVGSVDVFMATFGITVDLGVGTINLQTNVSEVDTVDLSVGVGDTQVRGGNRTKNQRALVSSDTSALGTGSNTIRARAGVGDITVELL